MNKITKVLIVLAFVITFIFSAGATETFAAVQKTSAKKVTVKKAAVKKSAKKSSSKKKVSAKKKTSSKKSTAKKSSSKRIVYSRGSGAPIAKGNAKEIVSIAKRYLGTRYVFGGSTPRGFDCSGFVKFVYSQIGVSLPRTASEQATKGLAIRKISDLKIGDCVFFETYAPGISHVGIYIGNNEIIHASNPKDGVKITKINGTSYASNFRGGTRMLQ